MGRKMYKGRYIFLKLVTIIFYPAHRELRVEVPVRGNLYFCPDLNRKKERKYELLQSEKY